MNRLGIFTASAALMLLAGCSVGYAIVEPLLLSTDELMARVKSGDCEKPPPSGYIRLLYRKYKDDDSNGRCGFFRASRIEAQWVLASFDAWETHRPQVVYKSSGTYPLYIQRVVSGGCPPGSTNCSD